MGRGGPGDRGGGRRGGSGELHTRRGAAAARTARPADRAGAAPVADPGPVHRAPTEPQIRLGLVVGAPVATVSGTAGLSVSDPSGARLAEIPAGEVWRVTAGGTGLVVLAPGGAGTTRRS